PPRAGLPKEIIALIAEDKPGTVIYISCAPDTLARDAARLSNAGYRIEKTQIFDMFPRTPYFESITVFTITGRTIREESNQ
ncbi:MAG TPA: 23S rRNA (uracil(1939)-C(5))-methyltransferase RlmD, partial [Proteobacteria bacterium]|nr:23S rRNA (uracil(1939)-C(5))-methyltransferase RlmD [Pseudomonadota bacterium]